MNDLISKEAVLKIIDNETQNTSDYLQHNTQINIRFAVDELPTVEPEPMRGEWEKVYGNLVKFFKCNKCGTFHEFTTNYCPTCGAMMKDMRGEKND